MADPSKKPTGKVTSLTAPARTSKGSYSYKSTWKVPSSLTNSKSKTRATQLEITKTISGTKGKSNFKITHTETVGVSTTSTTININNFTGQKKVGSGKAGKSKKFTRGSFYPIGSLKITELSVKVAAKNKKGTAAGNSASRSIKVPNKPSLSAPSLNNNGSVSCTFTPATDDGYTERYRTRYQVDVYDSSNKKGWVTVQNDTTTSDSAFTRSYDVANWQVKGKYVRVRFRGKSSGAAGGSGWTDYKYHTVGWPAVATLGKVEIKTKSDPLSYGYITVRTNSSDVAPVDKVILQVLKDTDAATAAQASASSDWKDSAYTDNAKCSALAFRIGEVTPEVGKHTWIRVKSWHDFENIFASFSAPVELEQLYTAPPGAGDNKCTIFNPSACSDGDSIEVTVAWDSKTSDTDQDTDGIELSWSTDEGSWKSTSPPTTYEFSWYDDEVASVAAAEWNRTATIRIRGLDKGQIYHIKARCYSTSGNEKQYGPYSKDVTAIPSSIPTSAVLSAPPFVPSGSSIPFSWGYSDGGVQTSWELVSNNTVLAHGTGRLTSHTLEADRVLAFAIDGTLEVFVRVSTGGGTVSSDPVTVRIAQAPKLTIEPIGELDAQPLRFGLSCNLSGCSVGYVISAQGAASDTPSGTLLQAEGDTIWSDTSDALEWALDAESGNYKASIELPTGLSFVDEANYTIEAFAVDSSTGLVNTADPIGFKVKWQHQAPEPSGDIVVKPSVNIDEEGDITRLCTIQLKAPDSAEEGDTYDVYRLTSDGATLVAAGLALDAILTDRFAPFGQDTAYRIACRTFDGDLAWDDFEYTLEGPALRLDFDGASYSYVELPWNLSVSDSYAKDFDLGLMMDGTKLGGWNSAIERTSRYETDVKRLAEPEKIAALRDMAQTAGAVFVRTSLGLAFEADVQLDGLDYSYESRAVMAVSLSATEIDLTPQYAANLIEQSPDEEGGDA